MSNPQIVVEMSADEAKMWAAFKKIETAEGGVENALKAIGRATKEVSNENKAMERDAKRLFEATRTSAEQQAQQLARISELYKKGKIDADTYARAVKQVQEAGSTAAAEHDKLQRAAQHVFDSVRTPAEIYASKLKELDRLLKQKLITTETYGRAVPQAKDELDASAKSGLAAYGPAAKSMLSGMIAMVGLGGGLAGAWRLVKNEIDAAVEANKRAAEASIPVSVAQAGALRNLGETSPEETAAFVKAIEDMSREEGVPQRDLYLLASDALSARGYLEVNDALRAVKTAIEVAPEDTGVARSLAGATLDLQKIQDITPEQSIGFLLKLGQAARITDTGALARNFAPAITSAVANNADLQTAGATYAALTGGMADPRGDQSRTAMIGLVTALKEFMPETKLMRERVEILQRDEVRRESFLEKYSFEKAAQTPIRELLSGKGQTAEAYRDYRARMPTPEQAGIYFEEWLKTFRGTSLQVTGALDRAGEAFREDLRSVDQGAARAGIVTKDLMETFQDIGLPNIASRLAKFGTEISGDELNVTLKILEDQAKRMASPVPQQKAKFLGTGTFGFQPIATPWAEAGGYDAVMMSKEATEINQKRAAVVFNYIREVKEILAREKTNPTPPTGKEPDLGDRRIGGPKPGDLITPVVPVPVSDLYQQERERTRPPDPAPWKPGRQYRTPEQREMLGAKYATTDPSTLPGGNPLLEKQTAVIEQSNKLLQEISNKISPNKPDRRPMPGSSSAANNVNRE